MRNRLGLSSSIPTNIVGWWKFNEGPGLIAQDYSGNNNHLNIIGATYVSGKTDTAINFAGTTSSYAIKNPVNTFPTTAFTITFWANTSDIQSSGMLSYTRPASGNNEILILNPSNIVVFVGDTSKTTNISVNDGSWHFVAITWDNSGQLIIYKDGVATSFTDFKIGYSIIGGGSLVIAQDQDTVGGGFAANQAFLGTLEDIRIYSSVLSSDEILQIYNDTNITNNLICHWKFEEGPGLVVQDYSGNTNHGIIKGDIVYTNGKIGDSALQFNGVGGSTTSGICLEIPSSDIINTLGQIGTNYSISLWYKTTSVANQSLTEKWIDTTYPWAIRAYNGRVSFYLYDGTNNPGISTGTGIYNDDEWHHVVVVRDATNDNIRLYVDNILINETDDTTTIDISNTGSFPIGARATTGTYSFNGSIDDVRIYNKVLSTDEISKLYNDGI